MKSKMDSSNNKTLSCLNMTHAANIGETFDITFKQLENVQEGPIRKNSFQGLVNLKDLCFDLCQILKLENEFLNGLDLLESLNFNFITRYGDHFFSDKLENWQIKKFDDLKFTNLKHLRILSLKGNGIENISTNIKGNCIIFLFL